MYIYYMIYDINCLVVKLPAHIIPARCYSSIVTSLQGADRMQQVGASGTVYSKRHSLRTEPSLRYE